MTAPPLRIVVDTNVYISAALRGGVSETVLQLAAASKIRLVVSPALVEELEEKLRDRLDWNRERIRVFVRAIRDLAETVRPEVRLSVVKEDDDDNRVLECAVAGEAALIVTFDRDLLRLRRYESIGIVTPQQLLFYGLRGD